jgi:hypothetical protein
VLNERCRVFLDLAEMLSDSIADTKMSTITWIVIILIVISIAITVTEVGLRFTLLSKEGQKGTATGELLGAENATELVEMCKGIGMGFVGLLGSDEL